LKSVSELWAYRNLTYNLAQRELRSRYKKSLLGWLWSLLNPASVLAVYTLVFGYFFDSQAPTAGNGHTSTFALYLFAGLWVWNLFNGTVLGAISALQSCPALANTITVLLQAMIEAGILLFIMILLGNVGWMLLLFPLLILCITLFSVGVGLALSVYNVFYRDVNYLVTIGMNVLFYGTPIIYSITLVENKSETLARIMQLNPIAQYVQWSRDIFYGLTMPSTTSLIVIPLASLAVFVLGLAIFNRKSRDIAQEL
jgi:ABC-type polysaccharide/polyol phosphate export permease